MDKNGHFKSAANVVFFANKYPREGLVTLFKKLCSGLTEKLVQGFHFTTNRLCGLHYQCPYPRLRARWAGRACAECRL